MKMSKLTCLFLLLSILFSSSIYAQAGKLPPFQIVQANGKIFKAQELPIGLPIVIIYFSPECDHCEKLTKELLKEETIFKKASVAMISHLPVDRISKFVQQYGLNKYSNVYVGTEGSSFFVRNYYNIEHMPFIALHDKNGNVVKLYRKEGALTDLVNQLNKLK